MQKQKLVLITAGANIEARGKLLVSPNRDGVYLDFMLYDEDSEIAITEKGWYGPSVNFNYEIYNKFKNKPVKITIEATE
jgi:hypothetical protein